MKKDYAEFMFNPDNYLNCQECPENRSFVEDSSRIAGPCGQQNCWVRMHCLAIEEEEE